MIYRLTVISKMKDKAKEEIEKIFTSYISYTIDEYRAGIKSQGFMFEIESSEEKDSAVNKIAEGIAKATKSSVTLTKFSNDSKVINP
jgi:hypothetical protein